MSSLDRTEMKSWNINDCADLLDAITEAKDLVEDESDDAYLSFAFMSKGEKNVDRVILIKIDLNDSFAYELVLE